MCEDCGWPQVYDECDGCGRALCHSCYDNGDGYCEACEEEDE